MNQAMITYYSSLVDELLNGIDDGDFSKDIIPDKYRWEHLLALFYLRDSLDGAEDLFVQLYDLAINNAEKYIKQKAQRGETIEIAFQSYSAAQWPAEQVYRMFEKTPNANVKVIVSPLIDRDEESSVDTYSNTLKWFKDNGYNVIEGMDCDTKEKYGWEKLGGFPDVIYQLSSWFTCLPDCQRFTKLPLRCLGAYIPYGMYLADNADGSYAIQKVYNKEIMNLLWRVYSDSNYNFNNYKKYQLLCGRNVRHSGYSKMDSFYEKKEFSDEDITRIWKIPEGKKPGEIKRVIIAPHYSVCEEGLIMYSTFKKNVWFWIYLAEKYKDRVSFVFKPHPNLRLASVEHKLFKTYEDYDAYIALWDNMDNGKAVQEADYLEIFKTSDAMIMDSCSFLGEYLYTGKPLMFLTRPEQCFSGIGKKALMAYYRTPGENYTEIERFIQEVVISGNDTMKVQRDKFFSEEYDYVSANGMTSSEYICNEVMSLIRAE